MPDDPCHVITIVSHPEELCSIMDTYVGMSTVLPGHMKECMPGPHRRLLQTATGHVQEAERAADRTASAAAASQKAVAACQQDLTRHRCHPAAKTVLLSAMVA